MATTKNEYVKTQLLKMCLCKAEAAAVAYFGMGRFIRVGFKAIRTQML